MFCISSDFLRMHFWKLNYRDKENKLVKTPLSDKNKS